MCMCVRMSAHGASDKRTLLQIAYSTELLGDSR